jgi:hypothetical protein
MVSRRSTSLAASTRPKLPFNEHTEDPAWRPPPPREAEAAREREMALEAQVHVQRVTGPENCPEADFRDAGELEA